jgi:hypothetical protein
MKNKKIWIGVSGMVVAFVMIYFNAIFSTAIDCEGISTCNNMPLPVWLYNLLELFLVFSLVVFIWGILEIIVNKYKSKKR